MRKGVFFLLIICVLVFNASSVAQPHSARAAELPKVVTDMVAAARVKIKKASLIEVKAAIEKKEKVILLDVRDPEEFLAGHLPGAINVSRGTLEFAIWGKIPDQNAKIYVYCRSANRATLATKTLNELGYKYAILFAAQFEDWKKAGYPIEK